MQRLAIVLSVVIVGLLSINPGAKVMADSQVTTLPKNEKSGKQFAIKSTLPKQSTSKSHGSHRAKEASKFQMPRLPTAEELKTEPCFEYNESDLKIPPGLI